MVTAFPILECFAKGYSSSKYSAKFTKFNFIPFKGTLSEIGYKETSNLEYFIVPFTIIKNVFEKNVLFNCRANISSFFAFTNSQICYHYFWNMSFRYLQRGNLGILFILNIVYIFLNHNSTILFLFIS